MALTKTRILSVLVLTLAGLNVALLAPLWLGRPGRQRPNHPGPGPVAAYVVHELGFTPAQQQQYAALRQAHQAKLRQLLPALTAHREQLFAGLARSAAAFQNQQLNQIASLERSIDSLTYAHFAQVGQLVTPAQQPRWQQIAPTLPRMLQQQGPRNRPGRPDGIRRGGPPDDGPFPDGPR